MEATKLKKKLNGSTFKGQRVRIDDAKPEKRKRLGDDEDAAVEDSKLKKRSKRIKPQDGVLPGHELEEGRKVKRGWTETPDEKSKEKKDKKKNKDGGDKKDKKDKKGKMPREPSKYTSEPECLFRTSLPAETEVLTGDDQLSKKDRKKTRRTITMHEFANTRKNATFLKGGKVETEGITTQEYVDGKGWVDAEGNVLEIETDRAREKRMRREKKERRKAEKLAQVDSRPDNDGETSAEATDKSSLYAKGEAKQEEVERSDTPVDTTLDEQVREIHPLEALFKRPKLPALDTEPPSTDQLSFSFFGADNDSDMEGDTVEHTRIELPQTPFTKQDMEWRGTRSAAPTPDTAAIGRSFSFNKMRYIEEDEEDQSDTKEQDSEVGVVEGLGISNDHGSFGVEAPEKEKEESEFAKWFFEHRSENNKKWRARRRESMKLKRKRENRRLTRRIV